MAKSNEERVRFANDEILGKGNLDVVDEIFATDYVVHAGSPPWRLHFAAYISTAAIIKRSKSGSDPREQVG